MAQRTMVVMEDDIDHGLADRHVTFSVDGVSYEIDLSTEHAGEFDAALSQWVRHARRTGGRVRPAKAASRSASEGAAMRAWARENGLEVSSRGRVSASVAQAYAARHQ